MAGRGTVEALAAIGLLVALAGCTRTPKPTLRLEVGRAEAERITFSPESSFAEYVELPGVGHELRITLASYAVGCEHWVGPGPGQVLVTVVVTTPQNFVPAAGAYPASAASEGPRAAVSARIGPRAHEFRPGGKLTLSAVELEARGAVSGVLAFESPATAERPAQSLSGSFQAKLCRVNKAGSP